MPAAGIHATGRVYGHAHVAPIVAPSLAERSGRLGWWVRCAPVPWATEGASADLTARSPAWPATEAASSTNRKPSPMTSGWGGRKWRAPFTAKAPGDSTSPAAPAFVTCPPIDSRGDWRSGDWHLRLMMHCAARVTGTTSATTVASFQRRPGQASQQLASSCLPWCSRDAAWQLHTRPQHAATASHFTRQRASLAGGRKHGRTASRAQLRGTRPGLRWPQAHLIRVGPPCGRHNLGVPGGAPAHARRTRLRQHATCPSRPLHQLRRSLGGTGLFQLWYTLHALLIVARFVERASTGHQVMH